MFRKIIILIIILSSLSLFSLLIIPSNIIKVMELGVPILIIFLWLIFRIYDHSFRFRQHFTVEINMILIAVVISMFAAHYFHKQSFGTTALSQRFIYFLMLYPLLHVLKPHPEELVRMMIYFGIIYAFLYLLQTVLYPTKISNVIMFMDRNTLRIALPGSGYLFLAYLIGLSRFIKTNNLIYLLLCMLAVAVFSLTGTRQILAPLALITILSILFSKKVKSRIMIITLVILALLPTYYIFKDTFDALFKVSQEQSTNLAENKRFKAAVFFLFEFFPNKLTYIIGNGVPSGNSPYGMQINAYKQLFGYFQSDIGIIGDYTKFGILLVIAQLSMFTRIMFIRMPAEFDFVKFNILASILSIFFGSSFSYAENIVVLCIMFYLADVASHYAKEASGSMPDISKSETQISLQ